MFIETKMVIFETTDIIFNHALGIITFIATHDNDERTIAISEIVSITKTHPLS